MSRVKFKLNRLGVAQLMKSNEMQGVLSKYATRIRNSCGDGFEQDMKVGKNRARAKVSAMTIIAKRRNAKYNLLLKAMR